MKKSMGPLGIFSVKGLKTPEKRVVSKFFTWLTTLSVSPLTNTYSMEVYKC